MSTIAVTPDDVLSEGRKEKKIKIDDKTKAAMNSGVSGAVIGGVGALAVEKLINHPNPGSDNGEESGITHPASPIQQVQQDVPAEVDPDTVMLDESHGGNTQETEVNADDYHPFTVSDPIELALNDSASEADPVEVIGDTTMKEDIGDDIDVILNELPFEEPIDFSEEIDIGLGIDDLESGQFDVQSDLLL